MRRKKLCKWKFFAFNLLFLHFFYSVFFDKKITSYFKKKLYLCKLD